MNKRMKYINNIGQKTGTSVNSVKVNNKDKVVATVERYQNLNSGNLLMNGLNSSVVSSSPASSDSLFNSCSRDGSNLG
ncbi:hypothetical protein WICPIJ_003378 [Wickerhamomyces pijperi]|uniref:Uncharacterized protein n=1 Tax=Wickerhamomyces pijperi TaxID=599730 RepID=A0A9P8Q802_WICPI|nr:hypothetical protein WICPIJ_003378 [Wickerhamomyces pijperi]